VRSRSGFPTGLSDLERNVELWTRINAEYTREQAAAKWAQDEIAWGTWDIPESELHVLGEVNGLDVVELGCGTAYVSAWLTRRGARVVAVDPTPAQLETARTCQREFGLDFPLIEAAAEEVPLPSASFDLAVSEYGAAIWADPDRWIPEAARLLRPSGQLVFLRGSTLAILCTPDEGPVGEGLERPQFATYRLEWPDGGVEFHPPHGDLLRILRESGFEVESLLELQAPAGAQTHAYYDHVSVDWARRWPAEEIWVARKRT
jgi:SAM-dependent methyltransferase